MTNDQLVGVACAVICAFFIMRYLKIWIFELRFYHARNWNFSVNSKYSGIATEGDIVLANNEGRPISNRSRVLIVMPLFILMAALGFSLGALFIWRGE
jgi:hypothetical protein